MADAKSTTLKTRDEQLVESVVEMERKSGSHLGIDVIAAPQVKVTKVSASSSFLGKLFIGDWIVSVNDQKITTRDEFFKIVSSTTKLKIRFKRDEFCTCKIKPLPPPRPGTESFDFEMVWRTGGMPIGILVYEDSQKRVIVSIVYSGTLAYESIKPGDIVTKVNGLQVPDKATAKKTIYQSVLEKQRVTMTVERAAQPVKLTTYAPSTELPASTKIGNFDLPLAPDVLTILERNRRFFDQPNPQPSILRQSTARKTCDAVSQFSQSSQTDTANSTKLGARLTLSNAKPEETAIEFENQGKPLQVTPKRT